MKAGRNNKRSDDTINNQSNHNTTTDNLPSGNSMMISMLPLVSMLIAILPGVLQSNEGIEIAKTGILTLVLTTVTTFYIRLNADGILNKRYAKTVITLAYLGSIGLLMFLPSPETLSFWMLGGLVVAMLIDNKLGLLLHFNLTFILGLTFSVHPETIILILILGVLMSLLANALKQKSTVIYAMIIILSSNVTLAFVINNFILEADTAYNYLNSLFSISAVLVAAYFLAVIFDRNINEASMNVPEQAIDSATQRVSAAQLSETLPGPLTPPVLALSKPDMNNAVDTEQIQAKAATIVEDKAFVEDEEPENLRILGLRTSYEVLCDYNNELLQKLRKHSESLFEHSVRIADLSSRAAKEIGANDLLARAGGLYHEIGKINGKNYIEEGLLIAEEYAFPKELKSILKEHNIKYEKPGSIEAAIVMLSDSVVSTLDYIEKTEEHKFTTNKIIDNTFQLRMEKGSFDNVPLSLKDFKQLKEFYQKEFNHQV